MLRYQKAITYIEVNFNKLFWLVSAIVFVLIVLRAFFVPFSHDEAATFFFYIQPNDYLPYKAFIDANNHFLNSALANLCYQIAGSHRFVLRLPNIFSFILLCLGIFKHFKYLQTIYSKIILVTFFILTANFLYFFELCRGYGLSIAFIVLGLAYLMDYFQYKKIKTLILFFICFQLALAANLILVVLFTILLFFLFVFQVKNKLFLNPSNIIVQVINIGILLFWIKFSFYLKEHGSLYTGAGDNYWEVSFKTLMLFLFGTDAIWIQVLISIVYASILLLAIKTFFQSLVLIDKLFTPKLFYTIVLTTIIIAFYAQKKLLNVNFPENRTGVFFYLLFVLSIASVMDSIPQKISSKISLSLLIPSLLFFIFTYNMHASSLFYNTIPNSMYNVLKEEAQKSKEVITIGGYRAEMVYAFLNYRGNSVLNNVDDTWQMTMNCDYYIAMKREKPYYKYFYDEIAFDDKWDRALLKRKEKIQRVELYKMPDMPKNFNGNNEFFEFFRLKDSALKTRNCKEVELEIKFNTVTVPFRADIVVQIIDNKGEMVNFKRASLNWLADDLNGQTKRLKLTTGVLPEKKFDIVVCLLNYKQAKINFTITEIKVLELKGKGVNVMIPDSYYKYLEEASNQPLL